jgi:hypothetical protein
MNRVALAIVLLGPVVLGCKAVEGDGQPLRMPPSAAPFAAAVPAHLDGFGKCRASRCELNLAAHATGDAATFSFARCAEPGAGCTEQRGQLTEPALTHVRALAERLQAEDLRPAYGCPGCTDGPIHELVLHHADGSQTRHLVDPTQAELLSPTLREVESLIAAVVDAAATCRGTELLTPEQGCAPKAH